MLRLARERIRARGSRDDDALKERAGCLLPASTCASARLSTTMPRVGGAKSAPGTESTRTLEVCGQDNSAAGPSTVGMDPVRRAELAADLVHFGKVEEAIAELKRCTEDYPGFAKAWGDLGYLHELRGESERAIECYQKYGELAPEDPASFEKIGDCFLAMRMRARAYQAYLRAAALHSDPPFSLLEKSARAESVLSKLRRRGAPLCARLCKRLLSPTFLAAFARELASLPRSIAAIRASGVAQFLGYLNRHYLEGDWRRHPALPCDLCGSRRFKPVFYYGMQKNVRCGNCGLEFVLKKPPESQDVFLNSYDGEEILQHFEKEW
ncbi:MAG: tetratricopeptide repeat protein, partial [Candidatus Omnitrophica bacterium]|nr:tetratricopeptide repeat protein [Candidatus Omnitrophota bacterium]